jgi:SAM-dependent methyltransferase
MVHTWLEGLAVGAGELNRRNILELIEGEHYPRICDLGCDDGAWTMELARAATAQEVHGVEIVDSRAALARERGVLVAVADLGNRLPYDDEYFDLVHSNQVIEHVGDLEIFLAEVHRILRPGGVSIISTENGSSWHNIAAATLGWQIFSLTNVSPRRAGVGNPFALHRGDQLDLASWTHKTIFNYRGLVEIHQLYGLQPTRVLGAGYHPLPPRVGRLDARHAHFLTVKATRVASSKPVTAPNTWAAHNPA